MVQHIQYNFKYFLPSDPQDRSRQVKIVWFFCLSSDTEKWKIASPMPTNRGDFAAGCVGDAIVVAGGLGQ